MPRTAKTKKKAAPGSSAHSRAPSEDRKARIVRAAIDCYIRSGVASTKMTEVAEAAGVDQPLIRYYFPTLESLYEEVVGVVLEEMKQIAVEAISRQADDPQKAMKAYITSYFGWIRDHRGLWSLWLYFYYLASYHAGFARLNTMIRENGRSRIQVLIYRGIEQGQYHPSRELTVDELSFMVQAIITANTVFCSTETSLDWDRIADLSVRSCMKILGYSR